MQLIICVHIIAKAQHFDGGKKLAACFSLAGAYHVHTQLREHMYFFCYPHKVFCRAEAPCVSAVRAARAVIEEVPAAASSSISLMAACSESQSERDTHRMTRNIGLTLPLKFIQAAVGKALVPVILLSEWLRFLMGNNLWFSLSGLSEPDEARSATQWQSFWDNYRKIHPGHPIFQRAAKGEIDLSRCAALLLHGDEGRTKKKHGILIVSVHSILGFGSHVSNRPGPEPYNKQKLNFVGPTWASRWILGALPKTFYDSDRHGDQHFQQYLSAFVPDIMSMYQEGFLNPFTGRQHYCVILQVMGDWPWLHKCFSLNRSFAHVAKQQTSRKPSTGICHACLADRPNLPWEDFQSRHPAWRNTVDTESPFTGTPSFCRLPHDRQRPSTFLGQDIFHGWHLGAAKQFLASTLVLLSETYPGRSVPTRFENMAADFFSWCQEAKENPYIRKLTRETVGWPSTAEFPQASWSKGSTSTVVLKWILVACRQRRDLIEPGSLLELGYAASHEIYNFISKSFREDVWMTRERGIEISSHGFAFLSLQAQAATMAHRAGRALYMYMPNLHRIHHLVYSLYDNAQISDVCLNIMVWNCQSEEDFIGRPSRVSRRVSPQQVIRRTLERALEAAFSKFVERGYLYV